MFVACGIWCLADVSSVSPSLAQTNYKGCNYRTLVRLVTSRAQIFRRTRVEV